jgi:predicted transposase YbfD/YdcC
MRKIRHIFNTLPDPRAPNALHDLLDIIVIAMATVLCGGQGATDMEVFASSKEKLLRQFLRLEHGIPSHDTFSRVFNALDPAAFEQAFRSFMAAFAEANGIKLTGVVAVDGKAVRGAYERGRSATPLHMVNVFATEARMALAACKAPGRNEAQGALDVLQMLSLEGCIVTADALHCNRPFAKKVLERGAHYVLALKENQSKLFAEVERWFTRSGKRSVAQRVEPSTHDRYESRRATVMRNTSLGATNRFPGVAAVARITSRRRLHGKPAGKPAVRYYLLSKYLPARRLLQIVRAHWSIENQLHWVLDVVFWRRRVSNQKKQRPRELRDLAAGCNQSHSSPPRPHLHATKGQTGRLGRCLPSQPHLSHAIALPSRGG